MSELSTASIGEDLPCDNCGYNLRTLSANGLCPECGNENALTIRRRAELAEMTRRRSLPRIEQCDAVAVGQWVEGLVCILVSFFVNAVGNAMAFDRDFSRRFTTTRAVAMGTLAAGWVVGNWGVWKLARHHDQQRRCYLLTTRLAIAIYTAFPVLLIFDVLSLAALLGGVLSIVLLNLRLAWICRVIRSRALQIQFYIFIASSLLFSGMILGLEHGPSSLSLIQSMPTPAYGSAAFVVLLFEPRLRNVGDPQVLLGIAATAWPMVCLVLLWVILFRTRSTLGRAGSTLGS